MTADNQWALFDNYNMLYISFRSLTSSASEASVASFSLLLPPEDIDISKVSSKDKVSYNYTFLCKWSNHAI